MSSQGEGKEPVERQGERQSSGAAQLCLGL